MQHRLAFILPIYIVMLVGSLTFAFGMRYDFGLSNTNWQQFYAALPLVLMVKLAAFGLVGEFQRTYRHASINDVLVTGGACLLSAGLFLTAYYTLSSDTFFLSRSITLIDCVTSVLLISGFRVGCRMLWNQRNGKTRSYRPENTLIYGTDETAIGIWKMLGSSSEQLGKYRVVGFIDPSTQPQRSLIGGQKVYSLPDCWEKETKNRIQHILVPTTVSGRVVRELLKDCKKAGIDLHKIPHVGEIVEGRFRLGVRELDIDDLLRRPPTKLDMDGIRDYVSGQDVLVSGGAGSIGSELCRQILDLKPRKLIVFDHSEFGIFQIEREFARRNKCETELVYVTASLLDQDGLRGVFEAHRPALVFHAAAYKHVPLMQDNPYAAIRNNWMGTKAIVDAAHDFDVKRFVLISTDKAVRPTSIMGATKLMAEKYLQAKASVSKTKFITVRFGNVLNSVGSVVPTFKQQIERGGPITVTDKNMVRYFMTIPEAVQLVLQSGAVGVSGNVLILDMGDPVKIVDLAKDMIELSGLSYPDDIEIRFTGLRPGEKMYEELFYSHEESAEKVHEKIFLGSGFAPTMMQINAELSTIKDKMHGPPEELKASFWKIVNHYVALDDQDAGDNRDVAAA